MITTFQQQADACRKAKRLVLTTSTSNALNDASATLSSLGLLQSEFKAIEEILIKCGYLEKAVAIHLLIEKK